MTTPPPSLPKLRQAWERALLARVQVKELAAWGDSTTAMLTAIIEDYRQLEAAYIEARVADRRERNAAARHE